MLDKSPIEDVPKELKKTLATSKKLQDLATKAIGLVDAADEAMGALDQQAQG